MDFVDILKDKSFVGREFLTWLWFRSDTSGGLVEIPGKRTIELHFLDKMVLDLSGSDSPQTVTITGGQSELREGMAALKEGKKIEEARISIKDAHEDFTVVVKAAWLSFTGFRPPPALPLDSTESPESDALFLEKMYLLEHFLEIIDELFSFFLELRLSDTWAAKELPAIKEWIRREAA